MTAKEKIEAQEKKYHRYCEAGHRCEVCNTFMTYDQAQLAHKIPQRKHWIKKYGKRIIYHDLNMKLVCSLDCNSVVNMDPAANRIEADKLVAEIKALENWGEE